MTKRITAERVVKTSFFVDLLDVIFNAGIAILTGSMVMLAESLQGLADLTTSALLWVGLKRSHKRADRQHRFGYGRELYFWTLVSGAMMLSVTATLSFYFGLQRFLNPVAINHTWSALLILFIGLVTNGYAFNLSYRRLQNGAPSSIWKSFTLSDLIETKATFILDLMGALAAAFGFISLLIFVITGNAQFDGLGAMLIGLGIAFLAFLLLSEVKDFLVGRSASTEVEALIRNEALKVKQVAHVVDMKTMYVGSEKLLVTLTIALKSHLTASIIEHVTEEIKDAIQVKVPSVSYLQVELESGP